MHRFFGGDRIMLQKIVLKNAFFIVGVKNQWFCNRICFLSNNTGNHSFTYFIFSSKTQFVLRQRWNLLRYDIK